MAEVLVVRAVKFVHERGILCAELFPTEKFAHGSAVLCAELFPTEKFAHERGILCAEFHLGKRLAPACRTLRTKVLF